MDDMRFADVMQQERERLHREREEIFNEQQSLENRARRNQSRASGGRCLRGSKDRQSGFVCPAIPWPSHPNRASR